MRSSTEKYKNRSVVAGIIAGAVVVSI